jgi:hypothetical protein
VPTILKHLLITVLVLAVSGAMFLLEIVYEPRMISAWYVALFPVPAAVTVAALPRAWNVWLVYGSTLMLGLLVGISVGIGYALTTKAPPADSGPHLMACIGIFVPLLLLARYPC